MRVLVLGKSRVAEVAAATVATHPGVRDVQIDSVDPTDAVSIRAAISGADIVINSLVPERSGSAVLEAAIDTGTHYLDACDHCGYLAAMLKLDNSAKAAGVCATIGMGVSPGVTNLLASSAASLLDSVNDVYTAWRVEALDSFDGADIQDPRQAAERWMEQLSGTSIVVRSGQLSHEPPLRAVTLNLTRGRNGTAYTAGGPEPVCLFRTLAPAGTCASLIVVTPGTAAYLDVLRRDIDRNRLTLEQASAQLDKPSTWRTLRSLTIASKFKPPGALPPFFAAASGLKDGRRRLVVAELVESPLALSAAQRFTTLAHGIGIPLGISLFQLIESNCFPPGVHPPEAVIDPYRYFGDLDRYSPHPPWEAMLTVEHADLETGQ
ncbi:hypothetical protein BKG77_09965 [Mycobacteroides chelonae]|nr:hypothetical protein BKG77_09965 [Mycobacteroides chelonae]